MNNAESVLEFRVPPKPYLCAQIRETVIAFGRRNGVGEDDLAYFVMALGEALANAIEHAHANVAIDVEIRVGGDRIVATVQDNGVGFASELVVRPELPAGFAERGRGLPIMRRCSHIFAVNSIPGRGTAVILGRYLRREDSSVA